MAEIAIFAIGSELLEGSIVDTNSAWLGSILTAKGANVTRVQLLPDNKDIMIKTLSECIGVYDVVLTTGGLGPTFDDITAEVVSEVTDKEFVFNETVWDHIHERLTSRGVRVKESHNRQAYLPEGCTLFENTKGTAFGFASEKEGTAIICMPGIPYEMKPMFELGIMPWVSNRISLRERSIIDLRVAGMPESDVDDAIHEIGIPKDVDCIINVSKGETFIKLRGFEKQELEDFGEKLRESFGKKFVGYGKDDLQTVALRKLDQHGLTLSVAESCTGGMLGAAITSVSGSSKTFLGGIISYNNDVKINNVGVPLQVILDHGAVSEECVDAMLDGVASVLKTDCSIAISGVAGPDGGTEEKPVGTVVIGIKVLDKKLVQTHSFVGDREDIRERAVKTALRDLSKLLDKLA